MKQKRRYVIDIILILIMVFSFGKIGIKYYQYYIEDKTYNEIKEYKPVIKEEKDKGIISQEVKNNMPKEEKLREVNEDYKFWIEIPNTNIDYPVVQEKDNDYYLNKNFNKEDSIAGSIFLDCNNDINKDRNLLIYGHHMRDRSMFADITKFKEQDFFYDSNNKIKIIKDGKVYVYEVFSVFVVDGDYEGLKVKFDSDESYNKYVEELNNKSIFKKDVKSNFSNIITLFTCSYEFDSARTIVCGTLVSNKYS